MSEVKREAKREAKSVANIKLSKTEIENIARELKLLQDEETKKKMIKNSYKQFKNSLKNRLQEIKTKTNIFNTDTVHFLDEDDKNIAELVCKPQYEKYLEVRELLDVIMCDILETMNTIKIDDYANIVEIDD